MKGGMNMKNTKELTFKVSWILLGLLMLGAGLLKLFVTGATGVAGMLSGIFLFSWAPIFWAWVLILSEIIFGALILAKWNLRYTTIPPMIILTIAVLFMVIRWSAIASTSWSNLVLHLLAINGYWALKNSGMHK